MDLSRKKRYLDKLLIIRERTEFCEKKSKELLDSETNLIEEQDLYSLWYAFQTMVQSILDIIAMICTDEKIDPRSDGVNVNAIVNKGLLSSDHLEVVNEARGLRNILVHEYNGIISNQAINSISKLLPSLTQISKVFKEWLKQH
jgi:uncharacterized protein YutE (UPF0331/DUF86 family)